MEKNGLGARNPSVRLVWYKSKFCGNERPNSELICPGVGRGFENFVGGGSRANTKGECQVEWSSPGTRYRLGANRLGFGQIPGGSVPGYVLDTVEVII